MLNDIQRGGVVRALATGAAAALSLSLLYQSLPKSSPPPPLKKVQSAGDLTSENNPEGVKSEAGPEPDAIWFGGGSWASAFHAGVLTGLREQFGGETVNNWKAGGASAGAAVAVGMLLGKTEFEFMTFFVVLAERGNRLGVVRKMSTYTAEFLRQWLPDDGDEWEYLNGRLFVAITRFPFGNEVISSWTSNRDLRNTLNASCCIPFYCNAEVLNIDNRWVLDGCLTQDTHDIPGCSRTVKVTIDITNTEANIMGTGFTPLDILMPGSEERMYQIFDKGKVMGKSWTPWTQVEGGLLINFIKNSVNLTARVGLATIARFLRMLEMTVEQTNLLSWEPLAMESAKKKKAKWEPAMSGRYMRRTSMSMGGGSF
jgi:hypothetical protein